MFSLHEIRWEEKNKKKEERIYQPHYLEEWETQGSCLFLSVSLLTWLSSLSLLHFVALSSGINNNTKTNVSNNIERYFSRCFLTPSPTIRRRVKQCIHYNCRAMVFTPAPTELLHEYFTHERNTIFHHHVKENEFISHYVHLWITFYLLPIVRKNSTIFTCHPCKPVNGLVSLYKRLMHLNINIIICHHYLGF